ncbi:MAG: polyprenyl synthetase family protein [Candidatus Bathyarchaeota archaeon]|nr:polyprenyl synthetase family protein [Candidatus Bathyarchaeota archaeon]
MNIEKEFKMIIAELRRLGKEAHDIAFETILSWNFECERLQEAAEYFMKDVWLNYQHPSLLAIACEAVGGKPEDTKMVGAAIVLLTGAADVHDDIIDKSKTKESKPTVYGKYGEDIAILIGDILLVQGHALLTRACEELPKEKGQMMIETIRNGFLKLAEAEALESKIRGDWKTPPEKLLEVIEKKSAVSEATAQAGAIIGNAKPKQIKDWAEIGKRLGILMNIIHEFIDMFEAEELMNRRDNECLPLPILYALEKPLIREKIHHILSKKELTDNDAADIADISMKTRSFKKFEAIIQNYAKEALKLLDIYLIKCKNVEVIRKLIILAMKKMYL